MTKFHTKQELIEQLKKLAEDTTERPLLKCIAMCYSPMLPPAPKKVKCEWCGKEIEEFGLFLLEPKRAQNIVKTISRLGYDVKLEKVCVECAINHNITSDEEGLCSNRLYWVFSFKTKEEEIYHTAISNTESDYDAVIAFLNNKPLYSDNYDTEHLIREELDLIERMTGISIK